MNRLSIAFVAAVMLALWTHRPVSADPAARPPESKPAERVRITKGPVIEWVGAKDAVIAWSTNLRSATALRYGTQKDALSEVAKAPLESTHRVHLRNLNPSTEYFFMVDSAEGSGPESAKAEGSFTTVAAGQKGRMYPKGRP